MIKNNALCPVKANLMLDKPNLTSIKFVIIENITP